MFRVAIQVKELISSNVTHVIDGASNPAKMLHRLQREIEEALIALEGERTRARRRKDRLEGELLQTEMREAAWSDKARVAMDHDREDLARQALLAREDCRKTIERLKDDLENVEADLAEIEDAISELETKREETRERARDQRAADGEACSTAGAVRASAADQHLERISRLEKRTDFATDETAAPRGHASIDREIEEMRRDSAIESELAAMRSKSAAKAKKPAGRGNKSKAA